MRVDSLVGKRYAKSSPAAEPFLFFGALGGLKCNYVVNKYTNRGCGGRVALKRSDQHTTRREDAIDREWVCLVHVRIERGANHSLAGPVLTFNA